jgi:hypothetical protein
MKQQFQQVDPIYRSLIQKAARRGHVKLVFTLATMIDLSGSSATRWFAQQAALTTFRACWPLAPACRFTRSFASKVAVMINVTQSVKTQDAAGLGAMAYALANGDQSVLNISENDGINSDGFLPEKGLWDQKRFAHHLKVMANAIMRPADFWDWVETRDTQGHTAAVRHFKNIGRPFDRAIIQAAAYMLTLTNQSPALFKVAPEDERFPYWVVFDHHVAQGKQALVQISRDLHLPYPQMKWMLFFYEGSNTQKRLSSIWWDRYCAWRFKKVGLSPEVSALIWTTARPQLMAALKEDASRLHRDIYLFKSAHLDRVKALMTQVAALVSPFDRVDVQQQPLF